MAYAQLGNTIFDGTQSFVSFSSDEEAVIVEHALINRKPRLQGTAPGLITLNITLFLHQQFCKVENEVTNLRNYKDSFTILPLLWGNGKLEGSFVIAQMGVNYPIMDSFGNKVAANVSLVLKESVIDNVIDQQQQQAQKSAIAVGTKQPATKSVRVNPVACNKLVAGLMSEIYSNAAVVDSYSTMAYFNTSSAPKVKASCNVIITDANKILTGTNTNGSCLYANTNIQNAAKTVISNANTVLADVSVSPIGTSLPPDNLSLQSSITALQSACSPIINSSIPR